PDGTRFPGAGHARDRPGTNPPNARSGAVVLRSRNIRQLRFCPRQAFLCINSHRIGRDCAHHKKRWAIIMRFRTPSLLAIATTLAIAASPALAQETPAAEAQADQAPPAEDTQIIVTGTRAQGDRKSTRLNSSHVEISYAVFCLKKKRIAGARGSRPTRHRWPPHTCCSRRAPVGPTRLVATTPRRSLSRA